MIVSIIFGYANFSSELASYAQGSFNATEATFGTPQFVAATIDNVPANATGWLVDLPKRPSMKAQWSTHKASVAAALGEVEEKSIEIVTQWRNRDSNKDTITAVEGLLSTAAELAPLYKAWAMRIVGRVPGAAFEAGPDDKYLLKSTHSTERKVQSRVAHSGRDEAYLVARFSDALRSTIVVDTAEQMREVLHAMAAATTGDSTTSSIQVENKFAAGVSYASGYVGVHTNMLFASTSSGAAVVVETQVHLRSIMDGTEECPKHYTHLFYQIERVLPKRRGVRTAALNSELDAVQMLAYAFGLQRALVNSSSTSSSTSIVLRGGTASSSNTKANTKATTRATLRGPATLTRLLAASAAPAAPAEARFHFQGGVLYRALLSDPDAPVAVRTETGSWRVVSEGGAAGGATNLNLEDAYHFHEAPPAASCH